MAFFTYDALHFILEWMIGCAHMMPESHILLLFRAFSVIEVCWKLVLLVQY